MIDRAKNTYEKANGRVRFSGTGFEYGPGVPGFYPAVRIVSVSMQKAIPKLALFKTEHRRFGGHGDQAPPTGIKHRIQPPNRMVPEGRAIVPIQDNRVNYTKTYQAIRRKYHG